MRLLIVATAICVVLVHPARSSPTEEKPSENKSLLSDKEDHADGIVTPQKRYSQGYLSSWRGKYLDNAAKKQLLAMFLSRRASQASKRSGSSADETGTPPPAAQDLSAYVILAGRIDDDILAAAIREAGLD